MRYKGRIELGDSINFTAHDEATEKALYDSFKIKRICRIADEQEDKENNMLLESIYKNDAEKIASYIISKYNGASSRIDVTDAIKSILSASNEKYSRECLDNAVYSSNYNTKAVKSARRNVYLGINKEANINDLRDIECEDYPKKYQKYKIFLSFEEEGYGNIECYGIGKYMIYKISIGIGQDYDEMYNSAYHESIHLIDYMRQKGSPADLDRKQGTLEFNEKINEFVKYNPTPHKINGRIDFKRIYGAFGKDSYKAIKRLSREGYFN